jgi:hypothetical protein
MSLKKGIINLDGREIEQYVLENEEDIQEFFKDKDDSIYRSLKSSFTKYINDGNTVILDTTKNRVGYYSWRTAGKDNWNLLRLL